MGDQFQFLIHGAPAGPVRDHWEDAAQDAVSAGLAIWGRDVHPIRAIQWADHGRAVIVRLAVVPAPGKIAPHRP